MFRNTPKIYDIESEDNHKICTLVAVHLLKGMHELTLNDQYEFLN